ncbi:helix-turn-helix protein [Sporomusa ovata DSM 2662]|uniref:HTH cro/C1-type domain-containing protein n=1 Tax=Sporomusa ovata TaxID=2378 RepID=A0A0U1KS65_9FIRM|nr:helix-turn-helix transcriptional regulator [Sporomusa ovata]EQB26168.1 putative transcriptional regulator [Sporomusa ovata DSM 2662]CQR70242.1 hypothetical protein SpAn4DRAFT_1211 [Sporomusa ovata]
MRKILKELNNSVEVRELTVLGGKQRMKFGDKVRYIRNKFSLTAEQLAKLLNVTQSYISHIENNRRQLSRDKIVILARKLNTPVEFFLRDDLNTLEEIGFEEKFRAMVNDEKYVNYFVLVNKAVAASISPEELDQAIEFLKKYNKAQEQLIQLFEKEPKNPAFKSAEREVEANSRKNPLAFIRCD